MSNLKIGTRLSAAFALILLLLGVMLAGALWQLEKINEAKATMAATSYKAKLATAWREGVATNSVRTLAKARTTDPAEEQALESEMKQVTAQVTKLQQELEALVTSERGKANLQAVAKQRSFYSAARTEIFKLKGEEGSSAAFKTAVSATLVPEMQKYLATVDDVVKFQDSLFQQANERIDEVYAQSKKFLIILGLIALACGVTLGVVLTRSITRPLAHAVDLAQQVAHGDLTAQIHVESKDEIGVLLGALKDMNANLLKTVSEVRSGTETIVSASQQIAAGNLDLSARTEQQASSLEETASSMEELTSTVRQNADNARQANALAQTASGIASRGGEVVSQVVLTMSSIDESSRKIADIIGVIDGIAFQTNILALNAAVEAARAGEQGRGFAVVASEVRNLAQRSAAAAKEIRGLIGASVDKVKAGSQLVEQAGATMGDIVQSIQRVTDIMAEIASASAEQTLGIEQVNAAITQMDDVTQQNAALVEEAAAAASSLEDQAATLARLVSTFKLEGGAAPREAALSSGLRQSFSVPVVQRVALP